MATEHGPSRAPLYGACWLADFSMFVFLFVVSRRFAEDGATGLQSGLVGLCNASCYALSSAASGHLSDRLGRRNVARLGCLVSMLTMGAAGLVDSHTALLVLVAFGGIGLGMFYPPVMAALTSGCDESRQRSGVLLRFCLAWNLGVLGGQLSGGVLYGQNLRPALWLAAAAVGVNLAILAVAWRPVKAGAPERPPSTYEPGPRERAFAYMGWIANLVTAFAISTILYIMPRLLVELNVPAEVHGAMLSVNRLVSLLIYLAMHATLFWRFRISVSMAAHFCSLIGALLVWQSSSMGVIWVGLVLLGVLMGYNYFAGIFYSLSGFADRHKGFASGMHEATIAVGLSVSSLAGGYLADVRGPRSPFLVTGILVTVSALAQAAIWLAAVRSRPPAPVVPEMTGGN